ncbi:DUF1854 domain-containing protein [bacterium]|nr:MAG: DUF1854 domain-containing protein [bacterium]
MAEIRYVEGREIRATRPEGGIHLRIEIENDRCIPNARVRRAFPLSSPVDYLSLQGADGKEIAMLRSLEEVELDSRRLIDEELDRRYFTPRIERIENLKSEAGMWRFNVDTQRGPAEFFVRNWRDSAVEIARGRWQIMSVDGGRFEIMDLDALDPHSLRLLDQLL